MFLRASQMDYSFQHVRLEKRIGFLQHLHNGWRSLRQHSVESGLPLTGSRTDNDLGHRLELIARDVKVTIEIMQHGISHSQEKACQKYYDIYGTVDQNRALLRRLERVEEELELKEAVTEAMNRRREEEALSSPNQAYGSGG